MRAPALVIIIRPSNVDFTVSAHQGLSLQLGSPVAIVAGNQGKTMHIPRNKRTATAHTGNWKYRSRL